MKNTFCLLRGDEAVLSQHFGDLDDEGVEEQWRQALRLMQEIYALPRSGWWLTPIPATALRGGRRRWRYRWSACCIIMPTLPPAWPSIAGRWTAAT